MSVLSGIESLTTLVFYGHDFEVLSFGEVPANLVNLVFEKCVIGSIELEEDVATPIETVIFQSVSTRSKFTIPSQAFPALQQLKVVRGNLKELVVEDEVATNGTALEIGNCRSLEKIAIGKGCFPNATTLTISKVASLYSLTVGVQSFEETDTWNIAAPMLKKFTLEGSNFTNMKTVDLQFPELLDFVCKKNALRGAKEFICENLQKLQSLVIGDNCFKECSKIFFIDLASLRQLVFGANSFGRVTDDDFSLQGDLSRLEYLEFGSRCFGKLDRFMLMKCSCLRTLHIGAGALAKCEYFVLLDYVNRVHFEEDKEKIQIIPEEYPGLPQEAEIQCLIYSFCVEVCHRLTSITLEEGCLKRVLHFDVSYLKRLKEISLPSNFMEDLKTFSMSDNAKLTELVIPDGCFPRVEYFSLQDHPALQTLDIADDVMANGGFCIMRNLYPTTINISKRSMLCKASSYKSIPKKLRRAIVKNLTPFQAKIASDAFLGQTLVGSISVLGLVSIVVVLLICIVS